MLLKEGRDQIPGPVNREGVWCLHLSARRAVSTATEELPPDRRTRSVRPAEHQHGPVFTRIGLIASQTEGLFLHGAKAAPPRRAEPTSLEGLIVL